MRNPFKFTATKPDVEDLYSRIQKGYSSSIEDFAPRDIHVLLFFYLSLGNWIENKAELNTESNIIKILKQTKNTLAYKDDRHKRLLSYSSYLDNPANFPTDLYVFAISTGLSLAKFKEVFNFAAGGTIIEDYLTAKAGTPVDLIINIEDVLQHFTHHITINPTMPPINVQSKAEIEIALTHAILRGDKKSSSFKLVDEESLDEA